MSDDIIERGRLLIDASRPPPDPMLVAVLDALTLSMGLIHERLDVMERLITAARRRVPIRDIDGRIIEVIDTIITPPGGS